MFIRGPWFIIVSALALMFATYGKNCETSQTSLISNLMIT